MQRDITPEEKLLNLIKRRAKKEKGANLSHEAPSHLPAGSHPASKLDERLSGIYKSSIFKNKFFEPVILRSVNKYLLIVLGVLVLYFLGEMILSRPSKNVQLLISKAESESSASTSATSGAKNAAIVKDFSSYSNSGPAKTVFGGAPAAAEDQSVTTGDISDKLGLVGIIAGDNPQAIIEDKKAQKTFYLNKGQTFNGYVVEEIEDNKVILDYEGRKISLFL